MPFDVPGPSQNVEVTVTLSDAGTIIAQLGATPTVLSGCCCPTLYTFSLSPVNGGEIKSNDQLVLNVSVIGNTELIAPCTGYDPLTTFTLYGTSTPTSGGALSPQECSTLLNLPFQKLAVGSKVKDIHASITGIHGSKRY